jgi:MSHA biogenesis protein MshE
MTGYKGRVAVYELLEIDREQADAIRRADLGAFAKSAAAKRDYVPLALRTIAMVAHGSTTVAEAMSAVSGLAAEQAPVAAAEEITPAAVDSLLTRTA